MTNNYLNKPEVVPFVSAKINKCKQICGPNEHIGTSSDGPLWLPLPRLVSNDDARIDVATLCKHVFVWGVKMSELVSEHFTAHLPKVERGSCVRPVIFCATKILCYPLQMRLSFTVYQKQICSSAVLLLSPSLSRSPEPAINIFITVSPVHSWRKYLRVAPVVFDRPPFIFFLPPKNLGLSKQTDINLFFLRISKGK